MVSKKHTLIITLPDSIVKSPGALAYTLGTIAGQIDEGEVEGKNWKLENYG